MTSIGTGVYEPEYSGEFLPERIAVYVHGSRAFMVESAMKRRPGPVGSRAPETVAQLVRDRGGMTLCIRDVPENVFRFAADYQDTAHQVELWTLSGTRPEFVCLELNHCVVSDLDISMDGLRWMASWKVHRSPHGTYGATIASDALPNLGWLVE